MEEFPPSPKRYRFGFYEVDTASHELRKRGVRVFLGEKPFELLSALLERPGEVITRKELRRRLWPGVNFLEFDNGLNTAVHRLREALLDSAQQGRYIETLPRVGYRFTGSLDPVVSPSEPAPARETKLIVLPLVNLTGDPAQEYFSDGMTEELITQLAAIAPVQLQVIARTSAMRYTATRKSAALIARELHVDYLVEGSVRRTGQRVRISAQLIRASDCMHVWANNYDRELRDILDLQAEVSQAIALQIHLLVHPAGTTQPLRKATLEPEAYDAYINGLYHLNKYNPDSLLKAIDFFSRAVASDPGFARAHGKLAMVRVLLGFWGWSPKDNLMRQAEDDALRTLRLDDNQPDAHAALGNVHWWHHWNFAAAERELERAVAVSPNDPMRRWAWFGFLGTVKEDHERAMAEAEAALELDPLSVLMRVETSWVLYWSRQFDRAIAGCREALTVEPDYPTAYWIIGLAQIGKSEFHPARDTFRSSFDRFGDSYSLAGFGAACGLSGQRPEAFRVLEELHRRSATEWVSEVYFAWVHIGLREPQKALDWLERAIDQRNPHVLWIRVSQLYDPLRGEPRFPELVARLNLPELFKTARPGQG